MNESKCPAFPEITTPLYLSKTCIKSNRQNLSELLIKSGKKLRSLPLILSEDLSYIFSIPSFLQTAHSEHIFFLKIIRI